MTLLAFGINHTTAPLAIREKMAFAPETLEQALQEARDQVQLQEVAILSTCNRTEVYVAGDAEMERLMRWLADHSQMGENELRDCWYCFQDEEAVRHMMKVAGGLDSLVLGEPQILGQMKSAYAVARQAGTIGGVLHTTFQQVFGIAKRVRSETAIGENPVSVAYAAVTLAQQIFSDLKEGTALLIGAGETIQLVARHLREQGMKRLIVANRTLARARNLTEEFDAEAILLADIPEQLHRADIVISSTASQLPLLGKGAVESALKRRKHKPMFMLDIAVPRDIEAQVGDLDDVYLYTVDDLQDVIDQNKQSRALAADQAKSIITEGVSQYRDELRARDAAATISAYRGKAEGYRDEELQKALRTLASGRDPERVLTQLARNLTNKLLHAPSAALREASTQGRAEVIHIARELFDLPDDDFAASANDSAGAANKPKGADAGNVDQKTRVTSET